MQTIREKILQNSLCRNKLFDDQQVIWEMGNMEEIVSAANFPAIQN
jgi:hypothetical protein